MLGVMFLTKPPRSPVYTVKYSVLVCKTVVCCAAVLVGLMGSVSAFAKTGPAPSLDFRTFAVPAGADRRFNSVKVQWLVRADASSYCASVPGTAGYLSRPVSCVYWQSQPDGCTVVTTDHTSHSELGHLFLQCIRRND
jgi:hypothetical protein